MKNVLKKIKGFVLLLSITLFLNGCTAIAVAAILAPGYARAVEIRNIQHPLDYSNYKDEYEFIGTAHRTNSCIEQHRFPIIIDAQDDLVTNLSKGLNKVFEKFIEETGVSLNGKSVELFKNEINRRFEEKILNEINVKMEKEDLNFNTKWMIVSIRKKLAIEAGSKVIESILKENSKLYFTKEIEEELRDRVKDGLEKY